MSKRPETVAVQEFRRRAHEEESRRVEAADAVIADYQRVLAEAFADGRSNVVCIDDSDGKPWYFVPHDAGDDDVPAPIQGLTYGVPEERNEEPVITVRTGNATLKAGVTVQVKTTPQQFSGGGDFVPASRAIVKPPGSGLLRLIDYLPGRVRLRKDIAQVIADMRDEHFEALSKGDSHGARLALMRGHVEAARAILPSWLGGLVATLARWLVGRLG